MSWSHDLPEHCNSPGGLDCCAQMVFPLCDTSGILVGLKNVFVLCDGRKFKFHLLFQLQPDALNADEHAGSFINLGHYKVTSWNYWSMNAAVASSTVHWKKINHFSKSILWKNIVLKQV